MVRNDTSGPFDSVTDLEPGQPVVHLRHGVGRFDGLTRIDAGGCEAEYLTLRYADDARLHVPLHALSAIGPWCARGRRDADAPLDRIGGTRWHAAGRDACRQARDVAHRLVRARAQRATRRRPPYRIDDDALIDFVAAFGHDETPDQIQAMREIGGDLAAEVPMDRVLCGDVGFGKTEVAMRAAFIVAQAGRQVAILVPTTLLVSQHLDAFRERFDGCGLAIAALSRLDDAAEQQRTLEGLADGSLDIVIGTHRLLGEDVQFAELGLAVIDEEHRFGVRQKQRVTAMREAIDVLTMTATPIPRTLAMSLEGLRSVSTLATAPVERQPVSTQIEPHDDARLAEACREELARGGQAYVLHNRIDSLPVRVRELERALPEARVAAAHGEMDETDLEEIMSAFADHEIDVLVATTIIENGLDVAAANTIVVEGVERFGLAQLHQLRGRVGRSDREGHALLLISPDATLGDEARERLAALADCQSLGAGAEIAARDLEIRGAGELLGTEQSGGVDTLGQAMFARLLRRAVHAFEGDGTSPERDGDGPDAEVQLGVPTFLPESWVGDPGTRTALYLRLADACTRADIGVVERDAVALHGPAPAAAVALFRTLELQLRCSALGISEVSLGPDGGRIEFADVTAVDRLALAERLSDRTQGLTLDGAGVVTVSAALDGLEARVAFLSDLLDALGDTGCPRAG